MIKQNVNLGDRTYPIYIETDYGSIEKCLESAKISGTIVVITDSNVDKFQCADLMSALESCKNPVYKYVIDAGEKSKNLMTIQKIYQYLMSLKLDRKATLVALGGGVVGDITGFAAATFLRGINFVQVPTTLLAQADSSVGGKVGVDFEGSKNIIGSFYQPKFVYINVNSLKTLPERELKAGLAEVVKHGIILDMEFFEYIDDNIDKIFKVNEDVMKYLTKVNCSIKAGIVEKDEKENGLREILNFGHTIGHAIESVMNFELLHGECIAIGFVGAFKLAGYMGMVNASELEKVISLLKKAGLPVRLEGLDVDRVYKQMFYDKKIKDNKLTFILPKSIGGVLQLIVDDEQLIKKVLGELR
ncbi:MAG: 3-dehydroquinate synthase [Bacillota bacterium]|nr:3-dehydroquinate synthase [Bacillota bacterium]